ncbi:tetratricopeptide repeat-containing response regulator [Duganella sp. Root336D2]|uniref:tetratricopeptide repeat-containing response regulator n=1 Tax=Duganella sp. Root336D2 TaxID=1736518 RepID=UPI0006FAEBC8|nr:tetratricopeptide repeat-containing response regulator [Duganella sp. Root336D2]KQV56434.1 transcriptional regulator [Duganella sp. Root336D2]
MEEYSDLSVLVIDPNQHMRSGLHKMLGQLGITRIEHGVSAGTAIRHLEKKAFDLVFCEYDLGNDQGQDGQQLLEDLRHHQLISPAAIFIMLTTEGVYSKVVSAAELTPTDYILKPFTVDVLAQRIARAVDRRAALRPIHQMIGRERLREAILASEVSAAANPRYATECARLRAEAHTALGEVAQAETIYREILETRPLGWAQLGLARCQFQQGQFADTLDTLQRLIDDNPRYMAAYDLIARTQQALGQPAEARAALEAAVSISPHMVRRLRHLGQVALQSGDLEAAEKTFKQVVAKSRYSEFRDPEDHVNLVRTLVRKGDAAGAANALRDLDRSARGSPATDACKAYSSALVQELNGNAGAAQSELAHAAHAAGAAATLSSALKLDLAENCLRHGMDEQGMQLLDALAGNPASGVSESDMAAVYERTGRAELAQNQGDSVERYLDGLVRQAAARSGQGDQRGAIEVLQVAVRRRPENAGLISALASAMLRLLGDSGWEAALGEQCAALLIRMRQADPHHPMLAALSSQYVTLRGKQ